MHLISESLRKRTLSGQLCDIYTEADLARYTFLEIIEQVVVKAMPTFSSVKRIHHSVRLKSWTEKLFKAGYYISFQPTPRDKPLWMISRLRKCLLRNSSRSDKELPPVQPRSIGIQCS